MTDAIGLTVERAGSQEFRHSISFATIDNPSITTVKEYQCIALGLLKVCLNASPGYRGAFFGCF
jgi:hypothetical protein